MKKKILFINGHLDSGGCERSLIDVLKKLDYKKYEVDLLLLEHTGDYLEEVPEEVNIKVYSLDNAFGRLVPCLVRAIRKKDWFSFWFRVEYICGTKVSRHFMVCMRKLFKDLRKSYDIVIAYRPGICTELAAFTFQANKKISWWHHGEMNLSYHEIKSLDMAYKKMDSIVAVSNSSKKLLEEQFADIKKKLYVVSNMIDPVELIKKARKYMPVEFQNTKFKIVSVGRMTPEKNMLLCPKIGCKLKAAGMDFKWVIIGDGVEKEKIEKEYQLYELQKELILIGRNSNPYPYIAEADLMIHPSLVESQGITIIESMALGTPVVAVRSKGPEEFIESGKNGYLVDNNEVDITNLIKILYKEPKKRELCAYNATNIIKQFEPDCIIKKIEELLDEKL